MGSSASAAFQVDAPDEKKKGGDQFEIEPPDKPGILDQAISKGNEYAGKALSAAGLPTSLSDVGHWAKGIFGQNPESKPFWQPAVDAIHDPTQRNIVGAVPFVGPTAVSMSDDVRKGNYGDAAATLGGSLGSAIAMKQVPAGLTAAKSELAAGRDVIADAAKEASGHSYAAGIAKRVLPKPAPPPNFRGGAYEEPPRPALGPETPTRSQFKLSQKIAAEQAPPQEPPAEYPGAHLPEASTFYEQRGKDIMDARRLQPGAFEEPAPEPQPVYPGAFKPEASEFYEQRGKEIMDAMRQQPEAFNPPQPEPEPSPEYPGAHLPDTGKFYQQRGNEIMSAMRQQPEAFRTGTPEEATTPSAVGKQPLPDVLRVPSPRELLPGEKVGYNASTPRRLLYGNALQGRPGAAEMMRNTGKTVLFTPPGGDIQSPSLESFRGDVGNAFQPASIGPQITVNPTGANGARPITPGLDQFESSFGPEHQEVGDLAEWETGSREGVRPRKPVTVPDEDEE